MNGACVAFAGSHAHTAALLAAALGQQDWSHELMQQARLTYQRLGAAGWSAEVGRAVVGIGPGKAGAEMVGSIYRRGGLWSITFNNRSATVPHSKGLADIARLLAAAGTELHVLDLMDAVDRSGTPGPLADRRALDAYRRRLADLESEVSEAERYRDAERVARLEAERHALLDEVSRVRGVRGTSRQFANHPAERPERPSLRASATPSAGSSPSFPSWPPTSTARSSPGRTVDTAGITARPGPSMTLQASDRTTPEDDLCLCERDLAKGPGPVRAGAPS